jgi:uridine phosphorylase
LGTSGALQKNIVIDTLIASSYGLGFDGLAHFYQNKKILEQKMGNTYTIHANWIGNLAAPYFIKASECLLAQFPELTHGITATAPGFYGPQGRALRLTPAISDLHEKMESFNYKGNRITNFEMETSALYYLGQTLGHHTLTICAVIGNRPTKEYSKDYKKTVKKMINLVLNRIC